MKTILTSAMLLALAATPVALAQRLVLGVSKCKQFSEMPAEQQSMIASWYVGYYTDEKDAEALDIEKMRSTIKEVSEFCAKNPGFTLSSAADGLLGK
jgi:hypothetical protein